MPNWTNWLLHSSHLKPHLTCRNSYIPTRIWIHSWVHGRIRQQEAKQILRRDWQPETDLPYAQISILWPISANAFLSWKSVPCVRCKDATCSLLINSFVKRLSANIVCIFWPNLQLRLLPSTSRHVDQCAVPAGRHPSVCDPTLNLSRTNRTWSFTMSPMAQDPYNPWEQWMHTRAE